MTHYICTGGCRTVSDKEGVCEVATCPNVGKPLESCDCGQGNHYGKFDKIVDKKVGMSENTKSVDTVPKEGE